MIAFATLFLGLFLGPQTVQLVVAPEVTRVDLVLDGEPVAELTAPPWATEIDLGDELAPHELVAVAYDETGDEIGRTRQTINLPRPLADAEIVLSGAGDGRDARARVSWQSVGGREPRSVRVRFDGTALDAPDPTSIALPDFDPGRLHFLSVELEFDDAVSVSVETAFGGTYTEELSFELTAVPLHVRGRPPSVEALTGFFSRGGEPLRVLAVDTESGELIVVRHAAAETALWDLVDEARSGRGVRVWPGQAVSGSGSGDLRWTAQLKRNQTLRFLWPVPRSSTQGGTRFDLFPPSPELRARDGGLLFFMAEIPPPPAAPGAERLADAVAVAGIMAAGRNRPRAVLLVLGPQDGDDASQLEVANAVGFLERLRVPLRVWRLGKPREGGADDPETGGGVGDWPGVTAIGSVADLERSVKRLAKVLDRQVIVWLEGLHPPDSIELRGATESFHLAR